MKVFVTGASGWVGSAVVQELIGAGHQVTGLARSETNVAALTKAGAKVHHGSLENLESLRSGAAAADGVIHCAFSHDFSKVKENCEDEKRAIEALGSTLAGSHRPLVVTSGVALVSPGRLATEGSVPSGDLPFPRDPEGAAFAWVSRGVRVSAVRLPPTVHGRGDHGFVAMLIKTAQEKGASAYVNEGNNRWSAGHRLDAAPLFRLALEKGLAGSRYHAVAEEGVSFREIATAIGRGLNLPVVSKSNQDAAAHFGWFLNFAAIDCPASSKKTRESLGWKPKQIELLEDIKANYF